MTQVQPVPDRAVTVKLEGGISVAVTVVPSVGALPALLTFIVNVAPDCPCVKFPECDLVMVSAGLALEGVIVNVTVLLTTLAGGFSRTVTSTVTSPVVCSGVSWARGCRLAGRNLAFAFIAL